MQKREQLDSLIDRLYKLRQKLDTVYKTDNSSGYNNERTNNAKSLEGLTTTDDTTRLSIAARNDSLRSTTLTQDSIRRNAAQAARNEPSPKKAVALSKKDEQQNTGSSDQSVSRAGDSAAAVFANSAMATRQQRLPDDAYEHYIRQSERLQADIVRLERQMINNRSFASTVVPSTANNRPVYTNTAPPQSGMYPQTVPAGRQLVRDTIVIRDTVFFEKTDTITRIVPGESTPVIVTVPKETIVKEKIDYSKLPPENILFASGQASIRQVYVDKLAYLADILRKNPELMISISGHTDKTGSPAANSLLSLKRANAVKMFFVRKGVNEKRMELTAVASEDPLVKGDTKNAKTQNRRVEIRILE
jgi:outer membrane protein OmpA-like peptidoglycan-associated protein